MSQVATGRRLVAVALLVLVGCNPVFGIETTQLIDAAEPGLDAQDVDLDDDFVLDVVDNCDEIPNPMQEDQDDDDIGDACDVCPAGSNHNEDGDALLDGCDNCPHVANDDQANTDQDAIGDACDYNAEENERRDRFDGFGTLTVDWIPAAYGWEVVDDSARQTSNAQPDEAGMWNRLLEVNGPKWWIETRIHFMAPPVTGDTVGLRTRFDDGRSQYLCFAQYDAIGNEWVMGTQGASGLIVAPDNVLSVRLFRDEVDVKCTVNGVTRSTTTLQTTRTHPGFATTASSARFEYIDVVSTN